MEKQYQKEINVGRMLKTLGKRWVAIILSFAIALIAGAAVGFFTTFNKKVYGVELDFYFYQIPTTDKEGNTIIGTATEYDETTMNMIFQNISSQSFIETIFCDNGIPKVEEGQSAEMTTAIALAKEKVAELNVARKALTKLSNELSIAKKTTATAKSTYDTEKVDYDAIRAEYNNAVQANATSVAAGGVPIVDITATGSEENPTLLWRLTNQTKEYNSAKSAYDSALKNEESIEKTYTDCQQQIIELNKEVRDAKNSAMALMRKQDSYKELMKKATKCIKVSYADESGTIKSTVRVAIEVKNDEEFAEILAENVIAQLPNYIVEKIDYNTSYCEQTNVLAEVEQTNKNETIINTALFGLIFGVVVGLVACVVVLMKHKQEYIVLVAYDKEDL